MVDERKEGERETAEGRTVDDGWVSDATRDSPFEDDEDPAAEDDEDPEEAAEVSSPRLLVDAPGAWSGKMPDAAALRVAETAAKATHGRPSEHMRSVVAAQVFFVITGAVAWWGLLHLGMNAAVLEIGWFLAAAIGAVLLAAGHLRRLTWLTVFGGVTSAGPLLFQMRGADLLLGYGLTVFNLLLAVLLGLSIVLALLAVREIDAVA